MTDLQWLAATILLTLLGAFPYVLQRMFKIGLMATIRVRSVAARSMSEAPTTRRS